MADSGEPIQLHRPLHPRDKAELDEATRDLQAACMAAVALIRATRIRVGLPPLPPPLS